MRTRAGGAAGGTADLGCDGLASLGVVAVLAFYSSKMKKKPSK